jgi:hypothetical protein
MENEKRQGDEIPESRHQGCTEEAECPDADYCVDKESIITYVAGIMQHWLGLPATAEDNDPNDEQ